MDSSNKQVSINKKLEQDLYAGNSQKLQLLVPYKGSTLVRYIPFPQKCDLNKKEQNFLVDSLQFTWTSLFGKREYILEVSPNGKFEGEQQSYAVKKFPTFTYVNFQVFSSFDKFITSNFSDTKDQQKIKVFWRVKAKINSQGTKVSDTNYFYMLFSSQNKNSEGENWYVSQGMMQSCQGCQHDCEFHCESTCEQECQRRGEGDY